MDFDRNSVDPRRKTTNRVVSTSSVRVITQSTDREGKGEGSEGFTAEERIVVNQDETTVANSTAEEAAN